MSRDDLLSGLITYVDELRTGYELYGESGVKQTIDAVIEGLPGWNDLPLKVGIIGRSGTGKSSFVNAFTGTSADEDRGAGVGVIESTRRKKEHPHPLNRKLVLCDLPGAGTENFPIKSYARDRRIQLHSFDMIIVIFCTRFTESEIHLLLEVLSEGLLCLFVRTKVALDIDNQRKAERRRFRSNPNAEDELIEQIRSDCRTNMASLPRDISIYLIDNFELEHEKLDFGHLSDRLLGDFNTLKKQAFVERSCHDVIRQIEAPKFHRREQASTSEQTDDGYCHIL